MRKTALEIRGLPKGVDENNIRFYMEDKDESTEVESLSLDSEVARVKLANVTGKKIHTNSTKRKFQEGIFSAVFVCNSGCGIQIGVCVRKSWCPIYCSK